ncbi:MAG: hypothetical protein IKJ45_04510, partial [Kiritimatiellae bacterium]|nr:hypothetical protein [Kiritimatiellia bacterium]
LQEIAETQGALFERLQDVSPDVDGCEFIRSYMKSETRSHLDSGDVYLATLGPSGLMNYYQTEDAPEIKHGPPLRGFAPNWIGQFYAQYQWHTGALSRVIVDKIPPEWLESAYPGLHDLDMRLAVEKVAAEVGDTLPATSHEHERLDHLRRC